MIDATGPAQPGRTPMDVRTILQSWHLGEVGEVEEVLSGSVNRVFRASTKAGLMYLRVYRTADREVVVREHALIMHVAAAGLPAVSPLANARGATLEMVGATPCAVYPAARGEQVEKAELGIEHAVAAGEMLGRLHACLLDAPRAAYRTYTLRWSRDAWIERLEDIARAVGARGHHPDDARVLQRIRDQCAWLADPRCTHEHTSSFAAQVVHGDYQHANLFFAADGVSAVIDWEQAAYVPRAFEVARAAAYMFELAAEPTRAFLHAYRSVTGIGEAELDDGAAAWGCMSDHYVWALEEVYLGSNERARRFIPLPFRPFREAWHDATR